MQKEQDKNLVISIAGSVGSMFIQNFLIHLFTHSFTHSFNCTWHLKLLKSEDCYFANDKI